MTDAKKTKQKLGPLQKKWIKAMRSGKYERGTGQLKTADGKYCCLGVAGTAALGLSDGYLCDHTLLDDYRALGLRSNGGCHSSACPEKSLTWLNDCGGGTFLEIADLLESDPSAYFKEPK